MHFKLSFTVCECLRESTRRVLDTLLCKFHFEILWQRIKLYRRYSQDCRKRRTVHNWSLLRSQGNLNHPSNDVMINIITPLYLRYGGGLASGGPLLFVDCHRRNIKINIITKILTYINRHVKNSFYCTLCFIQFNLMV